MKIFKKSVAVLLSVLMLVSVMAIAGISASAEEDTATQEAVIYFVNTENWAKVSAYCYASVGGDKISWPGEAATVVDDENGVYSYAPGDYDKIIFNNDGKGSQTGNLDVAGNEGKYYEPQTAAFYNTVAEALEATKSYVPAKYYVAGAEGLCGSNWLLKDKNLAMTSVDKDTFKLTLENVKAGTYEYKVNNGTWDESYPDGTENATVTVAEDGATVTILFNPAKGYPIAGVNGTPTYPEVVETQPTEATEATEPTAPVETTPVVSEGQTKINVTSNVADASSKTYDLKSDNTAILQFSLKAAEKLVNGQGYLEYDSKVLKLESFEMPNIADAVINTALADTVKFNYTNVVNTYDFTSAKVYAKATFTIIGSGDTTVNFVVEELNGLNGTKDVAYVTDSAKVGTFDLSTKLTAPSAETTKAPSLSAKSAKKNAGQTYKIKVNNKPSGAKVTYSTNKKKVATVSSKGVVSALTKGTATITVKVKQGSTVVKTLKFKMTVKNNPKLSKSSVTIKKVGKTVSVKITGKSASCKNSYKVAKKTIAKVTTKSKNAKTVKIKGLKKGKTTVTIKVNGKALKVKVTVK